MTILAGYGLTVPAHLPVLDTCELRSESEALNRLACVYLCSASAFGFPRQKSLAWAEAAGVRSCFEEEELQFLRGQKSDAPFRFQVEGVFALCWALGTEESSDWFEAVDDDFVRRLPDLKKGEPLDAFRSRVKMRDAHEIAQAADVGYCLHWAWRDAALRDDGSAPSVDEYVILERRRALEWLIGSNRWYEITLDT